MAKYIASYDLEDTDPSPYNVFLEAAAENGWSPWIQGKLDKWYRLPNTTLVGEFLSLDDAVDALRQARISAEKSIGVRLNMPKWIVSERAVAKFTSDETVDD